ncbi:NAD(P)-dependent oxidoreductase [Lentzea guizhouensis]|uniref:NAD(P)-dependent oxidoreductase n=1 Tax=Lentzea guizhouensis TaxID=1586287 RepID=A0A1B2HCX4_9PSEU|nr:NAD(P)H-binding protein [Lentzea guizhouensis]ANZ35575.1 NAD(P)-dependent oxidoreductase [Lentzea guizhouensis]
MTQEILVLGATGKTGRRVVDALQKTDVTIRAASRSSAVRFDWADRSTWQPALAGATGVYLIAPYDSADAAPFVELAGQQGVRRLVLLSGRGLDQTPRDVFVGMHAAEDAVRASGLEWTVLRANNFTQNFSEQIWEPEIRAGRLSLPMDDTPEPFVDVRDIAEVAVKALTEDHAGQTYDLSGPVGVTFPDAVAKIAAKTGKPIEFVQLTPEQYRDALLSYGVSEHEISELNGMFDGMRKGLLATPSDDIARLLGRPATSFDDYVADAWG